MMESSPSTKILLVRVTGQSRIEASLRALGWQVRESGAEDWFDGMTPEGPWTASVFDTTGVPQEAWLRLHRMVTRLPHPLILAVNGPVPSSFHYPRPGGLRVSLVPTDAAPDVVRSAVTLAVQAFLRVRSDEVEHNSQAQAWEDERKEILSLSIRQIQQSLELVLDLLENPQNSPKPELGALGPREREVQALLFKGLSLADLADRLGISESTVKKHVHAVYQKRGVSSRAQLMALK